MVLALHHNYRRTYPVAALLLSAFFSTCSSTVIRNADISIDEITERPEVEIPQGRVRGVNMVAYHGRRFFGFHGIPFAQPPIGNLRFKGPLPPKPWNGTLDASGDTNYCPQMVGSTVIGNEDCLYLHVYTPRLPASKNSTLLPVIVLFYGGRFKSGHSNPSRWNPRYLLDKDVILVVPSYRLGVLGFLSTGDEVSPGNYGLKDVVRALEWNRDNIQYFGGDPNQVTFFGSSSGAMSVHLLTLSKLTDGLFQRYITNSGTAIMHIAQSPRRVLAKRSIQLGEYVGCPTSTSRALVDCLTGLDASQLVDTESLFKGWDVFPQVVWGPTVEPDVDGALFSDSSLNLINAGKSHDLPWLHNLVRNEGIVFSSVFFKRPEVFEDFLGNIDDALPHILQYDSFVEDLDSYTAALKSYYLNDLTANRTLLMNNFTQLIGDALFVYPVHRASQIQMAYTKSSQYFCSLEYRGTLSYSYSFSNGSTDDYGVSHVDEMIYLFPNEEFPLGPPGSEMNEADSKMVDTMVQLWTSFATNGTPSTENLNTSVIWEPYDPARNNYLRVGNGTETSIGVGYNYPKDRIQFWEKLTAATSWKTF